MSAQTIIDFTKTTAIYGGSFDPIHEGHLHVAREILRLKPEIKQIVFVPAGQSPGKHPPFASRDQRFQWLESICKGQPNWKVWDIEIKRPGDSYTVDTLLEAHEQGASRAQLYLVMGADSYAQLQSWKSPERIRSLAKILVVDRPGFPVEKRHSDEILTIPTHPASSTEARKALSNNDFSLISEVIPAAIRTELKNLCSGPKNPYSIGERSNG